MKIPWLKSTAHSALAWDKECSKTAFDVKRILNNSWGWVHLQWILELYKLAMHSVLRGSSYFRRAKGILNHLESKGCRSPWFTKATAFLAHVTSTSYISQKCRKLHLNANQLTGQPNDTDYNKTIVIYIYIYVWVCIYVCVCLHVNIKLHKNIKYTYYTYKHVYICVPIVGPNRSKCSVFRLKVLLRWRHHPW